MEELFRKLNIHPKSLDNYKMAFQHSSYSNEHHESLNYERLEFLGDAVLELVVSDYLYKNMKKAEGDMTKLRASYVCENALCEYAKDLNLSKYIKVGHGEENDGGRFKKVILADIFEETIKFDVSPKKASNYIMGEVMRLIKVHDMDPEDINFSPENLAKLIKLTDKSVINISVAKEIFEKIFVNDIDPEKYVEENGLKQSNNEAEVKEIVIKVIENNPQSVSDFRNGKQKAMGYLVGQAMKESKGRANPTIINKLLRELL